MSALTPRQLRVLGEVRDNLAAADTYGIEACGKDVADVLRREFPEISDSVLASLMGNLTAYGQKFDKVNADATVVELTAVFAFAAIELAAVDLLDGES